MELIRDVPRWAVPFLKPARYKGAKGGRGSGKSHEFAAQMIEEHIADADTSSVCVREVQKTLSQSVKRLLEYKIEELNAGSYFEVLDSVIRNKQGKGQVIFQGMQNHTADSIKSLEGYNRSWVEEAQSLSQRSLDLLRPTIRAENSELWFTWNPRAKTDPIEQLLCGDELPPDSVVVQVNYTENPWFPDVLRKEMEYDQKRDMEKFEHVWLGAYEGSTESRVFKNWVVEEFERPQGTVFRLGADWGFSVDPSVLVRASIEANRLYIDHEAYMIGCEIVNLPELFMSIPAAEKWPIIADSARPETISHMQKHGFPKIRAAIKGPKSLEEGVEFLKSFDIVVHPRCIHTIDELSMYSYKTDDLTGEVLPVLEDKHNHVIDALRYSCEGARRAIKEKKKQETIERHTFNHSHGWMG